MRVVYIMLMENTIKTGGNIERVFDLKGSLADRYVKNGSVLKDRNLLELRESV